MTVRLPTCTLLVAGGWWRSVMLAVCFCMALLMLLHQGRIPYHNGLAGNGQPPNAGMREWGIDRTFTFLPETLREHGN